MTEIHNKNPRQPHYVAECDWPQWLGPLNDEEIRAMLHVYPDDNMQAQEYELPKPPPVEPKNDPEQPLLF